ncbi:MAG: di-heme oxidoredictase family protein [Myxococcota bacterium]
MGLMAACGDAGDDAAARLADLEVRGDDPTDLPLAALSSEQLSRFRAGDAEFDESARETQGLGPLFVRARCSACHENDSKGPGAVQKFVLVLADGITPQEDQSALPYGHTGRTQLAAGATVGITPPGSSNVKVTTRLGLAVFGRGFIEAVDAGAIEAGAASQTTRDDGISGRVNYVAWRSRANPLSLTHDYAPGDQGLIGRFGTKARSPTIDDFVADAYQGDMGLTSPLRPFELPNPDALEDDEKPGVDVTLEQVELVADYVRLLDMPVRGDLAGPGAGLFESVRCSACHTPSMPTRADYPIPQLAGVDASIYSDLLLHDMGDGLADGIAEESADGREWRTAPLIGLRHLRGFMHDGRAKTVADAIEAHRGGGSEANDSVDRYERLTDTERGELVTFVQRL